jgi:hypothetical protein
MEVHDSECTGRPAARHSGPGWVRQEARARARTEGQPLDREAAELAPRREVLRELDLGSFAPARSVCWSVT